MKEKRKAKFFTKHSWKWLMCLFLLVGIFLKSPGVVERNSVLTDVNHVVAGTVSNQVERQNILTEFSHWIEGVSGVDHYQSIYGLVTIEQREVNLAQNFLNLSVEHRNKQLGRQLMINPDFINGKVGWLEYRSDWRIDYVPSFNTEEHIAITSRLGEGSSNLSQLLELKTGRCYLFMVEGRTERRDDISTLWLYWATYENGVPKGNVQIQGHDNQAWDHYIDVFCLPEQQEETILVNVAPISLYGDVSAILGSSRIYELVSGNE